MTKTGSGNHLRLVGASKAALKAAPKAGKGRVHNLAHVQRDRGYRFADRDPKMVELCTLIYQSELSVHTICNEVSRVSKGMYRVSDTTVANWLIGKTRRPQSFTMDWVAHALGYERKWTKIR